MLLYVAIHGVALIILQNIFFIEHKVEARNGHIIPLGSLFNSIERKHLKNSLIKSEAASYENENVEYPIYKKRKPKKKHKIVPHKNLIGQHSNVNQEHKKKIKKRPSFINKRFIKTTLREKDSKMSDSIEGDVNRKPVDIIVHIKMND